MVDKSVHPADWSSNSGSLRPLPDISYQTLERLTHWPEVLELTAGSPDTHPYTCLTSELPLAQLGPRDPGCVCNSTKSRGPRAPSCLWPPSLGSHDSQGSRVGDLGGGGQKGPSAQGQGSRQGFADRTPSPLSMAHRGKLRPGEQRGLAKVTEQASIFRGPGMGVAQN